MKAIHLTAYGNPAQDLRLVEVSEPDTPSADEALVRMEYAPIAYSDLLLAHGVYLLKPKLPSVYLFTDPRKAKRQGKSSASSQKRRTTVGRGDRA